MDDSSVEPRKEKVMREGIGESEMEQLAPE